MKRILALILAILMVVGALVSCSNLEDNSAPDNDKAQNQENEKGEENKPNKESGTSNNTVGNKCTHIDEAKDHECDKCGANMYTHADSANDGDHLCEYCGNVASNCKDYDKNHVCNECGANVGIHADGSNDGNHKCDYCDAVITNCNDSNKDHDCDECGIEMGTHDDSLNDGNHKCDYCDAVITNCNDSDKDHDCDECGIEMGTHDDSSNDGNHECDYCDAVITNCNDSDKDHDCDECGANIGTHADSSNDGNHKCDYCNDVITNCNDYDKDHDCDECGARIGTHADSSNDGNHTCDYGCGATLTSCNDSDKDHACDDCGASMGTHADTENDGNHTCDYSCGATLTSCDDSDKDHDCDECGANMGTHSDSANDGNHLCEYCDKVASNCEDSDKNHVCNECGANVGTHADSSNDGNHTCDYGCGATLTSCNDSDKDHDCDDCGASIGTHADSSNDGNHTCDYGCGATLTSCNDSDKDHDCDECGANMGTHSDSANDGNHTCDYGCGATLTSCNDSDKDHDCDECGASMGTHADTENDGNHTCDYGCGATLTSCNDSDKDHDCDDCGATSSHNYKNDYCTVCGAKQPYAFNGNKITFGSYPQSEVTDSSLTATLNSKAGTLPTSSNSQDWTSYGYYINGNVYNFMWYIDVDEGGEKYRGVYFTSYRPYRTTKYTPPLSTANTCQYDNGYKVSTVYWFKYEPISWTILSENMTDGTALILCDMIIDSQEYYITDSGTRTIDGKTVYPNNYAHSTIRKWLNETFYNTAFSELQKQIILTTMVDNGRENIYDRENTEDKIFLLSYVEAKSSSYGLNSTAARQKKTTDYAQAQGGCNYWWLRSPDELNASEALGVYGDGTFAGTFADYCFDVHSTSDGVVPALQIRLGSVEPDDAYTRNANKITFGSYPQSEVTDSSLTATLNSKAGPLPTSSNSQAWMSYGYYINRNVENFMWYIDIEQGGEKYRGVYFTSYRPSNITDPTSPFPTDNTYQDDNGYTTSTVYWFKYEPISWTILSENTTDGTALILCDMIIDSQEYYINSYNRTIDGKTVYANNYAHSTIRKWLNETFYNTAFSWLQKQIILTTTVDNSAATTDSSTNENACENTQDKIFLLSYQDVINSNYGFSSSYSAYDTARQKKTTDYAQAQGALASTSTNLADNGYWWLRSPFYITSHNSYYAHTVCSKGYVNSGDSVSCTDNGVVPALQIKL